VEVAQKMEEEWAAEDIAGEIVERVVEETDVEKQRLRSAARALRTDSSAGLL
jgi:hypothetical protein